MLTLSGLLLMLGAWEVPKFRWRQNEELCGSWVGNLCPTSRFPTVSNAMALGLLTSVRNWEAVPWMTPVLLENLRISPPLSATQRFLAVSKAMALGDIRSAPVVKVLTLASLKIGFRSSPVVLTKCTTLALAALLAAQLMTHRSPLPGWKANPATEFSAVDRTAEVLAWMPPGPAFPKRTKRLGIAAGAVATATHRFPAVS